MGKSESLDTGLRYMCDVRMGMESGTESMVYLLIFPFPQNARGHLLSILKYLPSAPDRIKMTKLQIQQEHTKT